MNQETTAGSSPREKDAFSERTKLNLWVQALILGLAGTVGAAGLALIFKGDSEEKVWGLGIIVVLVVVYIVFLFVCLMLYRDAAVDQCRALAEKLGLELTVEQAITLQRLITAGLVFQEFVEKLLPTENLARPKDNYFAASGGQTQEACRRFVAFLHNNPGEYRRTN